MIKTEIADGNGGLTAQVRQRTEEGHQHKHPAGLMTYTEPYALEINRPLIAVDANGSSAMNVNGSTAGGSPDRVHDGIDSVLWTGTNLSGSGFVFNSTTVAQTGTNSVDATGSVNNDQALFTRSSAITHADYSAFTGFIYITSWPTAGTKNVRVRFRLAGSDIGNEIDISTYIDPTTFDTWQSFTIPMTEFALAGTTTDEIVITTVDIGGGQPPNYYLDELVLASTAGGVPVKYTIAPRAGEIINIWGFSYMMVFPWTQIATVAGATENFGAMPYLSYDKFGHLTRLTNGLTVQRIQKDVAGFAIQFRDNYDILSGTTQRIDTMLSDGTNTFLKISADFTAKVELDSHTNDRYEFTVNDNLSTFLKFQIRARAATVTEALG
jgi:hypothetical protein